MNKSRLLQIINRLELNPKDKSDLVNIISSNSENANMPSDWEAAEGEQGYIKNRTHWYKERPISVEIISDDKAIINNVNPELGASFFKVKTLDTNFYPTYKLIDPRYDNDPISDVDGLFSIRFFRESDRYIITGNVNNLDLFDIRHINYDNIYKLGDCFISDNIARVDDYERPHIKLNIINPTYNLNILSQLSLSYVYVCDLFSSTIGIINNNSIWKIQNGELYNGVITGISGGKLVKYDVNFETGEITLKQTTNLELISSEVKLDVCSAGSTEAARNLELLNLAYVEIGDHFTVNIDGGIGVGKFIPEAGGEGHITTASGVQVHYTFGSDGSVTKTMEIDIVALYNKVESLSV